MLNPWLESTEQALRDAVVDQANTSGKDAGGWNGAGESAGASENLDFVAVLRWAEVLNKESISGFALAGTNSIPVVKEVGASQ